MSAAAAVFVPLLVAYATTLWWVGERWSAPTQYYAHGWLLPLLGAFVAWSRRATWSKVPAAVDRRALWLLGPGLVLHGAGALLMIDSLSASSLCFTVPGAAWLALGRARLRGLWPVLWLVLFAVPPPIYVEGRVSFLLKEFAVGAGAALANAMGADVARAGSDLRLVGTDEALFVADACGGLRSLLAMVTLGYCIAFFVGAATWRRRIALLFVAVPVAVGANVVRIAALCAMARRFGVPFAEGTGHTLANVLEWFADVAVLLLVDRLASLGAAAGAPSQPVVAPAAVAAPPGGQRAPVRALWALALPLLLLSWYRPGISAVDRAARLPHELAGYRLAPRTAEEEEHFRRDLPRWTELLGTADFLYGAYVRADGASIQLTAVFHDANWKSVHPPRICIEGSNMEIEIDDLVTAPWLDGGGTLSRIVAWGRADRRLHLTYSVFGTADWASGDYGDFTWHHAPRALLRRPQSGFLLRVETTVEPGEPADAAPKRCDAFLRELVPAARRLLS